MLEPFEKLSSFPCDRRLWGVGFRGGRFTFCRKGTVRSVAGFDETLSEQDAQGVAFRGTGNNMRTQPGAQEGFSVVTRTPRCRRLEQLANEGLHHGDVDDAVLVTVTLIGKSDEPTQTGGVIDKQFRPNIPE